MQLTNKSTTSSASAHADLAVAKNKLQSILETKAQDHLIRVRVISLESGETSKWFAAALELSKAWAAHITEIKIEDKPSVTTRIEMLSEVITFYKNLFKEEPVDPQEVNEFLTPLVDRLSLNAIEFLEKDFLDDEYKTAARSLKPGNLQV